MFFLRFRYAASNIFPLIEKGVHNRCVKPIKKYLRYQMRRATTPTHTFSFPHEYVGKISKILVTYSQNGETILNKTEKDGTIDGNKFYFTLTQEETNLFNTTYYVEVQIRILTSDNVAVASDVAVEPCEKVLNDEVL